jgi:hypothetical protein
VLLVAAACSGGARPTRARCVASDFVAQIAVTNVDRFDLLFVISDAPSMAAKQAVLQRELPGIVRMLVTGELGGVPRFEPIQDLQVGVVSASLADGIALHRAPASGGGACAQEYPGFLRYRGSYYGPARDDVPAYLQDVECMTRVGSEASGPSQPLEAALRVLSDPSASAGFLRSDPIKGLSTIAILVVSDSDDCSLATDAGGAGLSPASTAACAEHGEALQELGHYVDALRALRRGNENLVQLGVIAGVPPALVEFTPAAAPDLSDTRMRDTYYQSILADPAMQIVPEADDPQRLRPACSRGDAGAEPARRLATVAQGFGANAWLASICADNWSAVLAPLLIRVIAKQLGNVCLSRPLQRGSDGRIPCKVFWDLPPRGFAPEGTPVRCSERPYLAAAGASANNPEGRRCEVAQAAITNDGEFAAADPSAGFFYDDFSENVRTTCAGPRKANIAFTDFARPPTGVSVSLECVELEVAAEAGDAGSVEPAVCSADYVPPWPGAWSIGQHCTPRAIPSHGYDDREVWIETGTPDCGSGVCMVYHLRGDPRPGCVPGPAVWTDPSPAVCAAGEEAASRIYCSCRCDAPDPAARTCACPQGFSCRPTLNQDGNALAGSYCVKE